MIKMETQYKGLRLLVGFVRINQIRIDSDHSSEEFDPKAKDIQRYLHNKLPEIQRNFPQNKLPSLTNARIMDNKLRGLREKSESGVLIEPESGKYLNKNTMDNSNSNVLMHR